MRSSQEFTVPQHVFAHQKGLLNLTIRTIGLARARVKIGLANLAYNMRRFFWLQTKYVLARSGKCHKPSQPCHAYCHDGEDGPLAQVFSSPRRRLSRRSRLGLSRKSAKPSRSCHAV